MSDPSTAIKTDETTITYVEARSLHESPTNPRRHFDNQGLEELAASIREQGIINPLLVRQIPDEARDRGKGKRGLGPMYEVICGARRLRAARAVGQEHIPVVVRDLSDARALEIQVVENLQREDVHPLDEAQGFGALMQTCRYDVAAVAAKVGRSQSYVYQRLKLGELIGPAQKALWEEKITAAHAILIARLQPKEQAEALKHALRADWQGIRYVSAAELDRWIRNEILLDLPAAPFREADAPDLVASAPLCKDCKRRTGYAPALWPELAKRDLCTDRACYRAKTTAFIEGAIAGAKAKGEPLLRLDAGYSGGRDKSAICGCDYREIGRNEKCCEAAVKGIMVADSEKPGQTLTVCPRSSKCKQHWGSYSLVRSPSEIAREKQRKAAGRAAAHAGQLVLAKIMEQARPQPFSAPAMRLLYGSQAQRLDHNIAKRMCDQLGLKPGKNNWGGIDYRGALAARFDQAPAKEIATAAVELALEMDLANSLNAHQCDGKHDHLRAQGLIWGVDVAAIERQVAAEEKARVDAAAAREKAKSARDKAVKKATPAAARAAAKAKAGKLALKAKGAKKPKQAKEG